MPVFHFYDKDDPAVPDYGYHHYLVTAPNKATARVAFKRSVPAEVVSRHRASSRPWNPRDWEPGAYVTRITASSNDARVADPRRPSVKAKKRKAAVKRALRKAPRPKTRPKARPKARPKKRRKKKSTIGKLAGRLQRKFYERFGGRFGL